MRPTWIGIASLVGAMQFVDCPGEGQAQESGAQSRRLKGHVFLSPTLQDGPFVTTHLGIREGIAVYDLPDLQLGQLGTYDVARSGMQQSIELGLGITEWFGLFGFGRALLMNGVDRPSLTADAGQVDFVAKGGLVARLLRNESTGSQVAVRARIGYRPTSETSLGGGAHAAQYINRYLSAQAAVTVEHSWQQREPFSVDLDRRVADDADVFRLQLAAAVEFDFSLLVAPVSFLAEYMYLHGRRNADAGPDNDIGGSSLGLGIYYVGHPNLQLGVGGITTLDAKPRKGLGTEDEADFSGQPTLTYVDLIFRYTW